MRQAGTEELGQDGKGKGEGEGGLPPCSDGPPQPHAVRYPLPFTPFPPDPSFPGPVPLFTYRLQVVAGSSHASQALLSALPTPTSPSTAPMFSTRSNAGGGEEEEERFRGQRRTAGSGRSRPGPLPAEPVAPGSCAAAHKCGQHHSPPSLSVALARSRSSLRSLISPPFPSPLALISRWGENPKRRKGTPQPPATSPLTLLPPLLHLPVRPGRDGVAAVSNGRVTHLNREPRAGLLCHARQVALCFSPSHPLTHAQFSRSAPLPILMKHPRISSGRDRNETPRQMKLRWDEMYESVCSRTYRVCSEIRC